MREEKKINARLGHFLLNILNFFNCYWLNTTESTSNENKTNIHRVDIDCGVTANYYRHRPLKQSKMSSKSNQYELAINRALYACKLTQNSNLRLRFELPGSATAPSATLIVPGDTSNAKVNQNRRK